MSGLCTTGAWESDRDYRRIPCIGMQVLAKVLGFHREIQGALVYHITRGNNNHDKISMCHCWRG